MGKPGSTSAKRQREADKAAKARAKRERRQQSEHEAQGGHSGDEQAEVPPAAVLERLAELHREFQDGQIGFAEYDEAKAALLRQLRVD